MLGVLWATSALICEEGGGGDRGAEDVNKLSEIKRGLF